jgi:NAD-dependent deacetylase sirtuin 4
VLGVGLFLFFCYILFIGRFLYLSFALLSTESGIPDYRSPTHGSYSKGHKPTTYAEFTRSHVVRQRYWARNMIGWSFFNSRQPNRGHIYLAKIEKLGFISQIITQNVDTLHEMAGSQSVIHLHGTNQEVVCLTCRRVTSREHLQRRLIDLNPHWLDVIAKEFSSSSENILQKMNRPDGDAELGHLNFSSFRVPSCEYCGGILKPAIVMFGENVPSEIAERAKKSVQYANGLLILGTSLATLSSYRLVQEAFERRQPIALVNFGPTRADSLVSFKIEARIGDVLEKTFHFMTTIKLS